MLKCKCGNDMVDNFRWEQSYDTYNEYKCRDCGEFVNEFVNHTHNNTTNVAELECGCTLLEVEE
ncbi:MAG: hypothetical protein ACRDD7_06815 [Peptostreptococcaceae bacterium]